MIGSGTRETPPRMQPTDVAASKPSSTDIAEKTQKSKRIPQRATSKRIPVEQKAALSRCAVCFALFFRHSGTYLRFDKEISNGLHSPWRYTRRNLRLRETFCRVDWPVSNRCSHETSPHRSSQPSSRNLLQPPKCSKTLLCSVENSKKKTHTGVERTFTSFLFL